MKQSVIAVFVAVLLLLTGCEASGEKPEYNTDTMRVSAILPHRDNGYWTFVAEGLMEADQRLPMDVKIYTPNLNYNVDQMTELIQQQIAAQVDALIVQGINDPKYIAALEKAKAQDIRVILVDTDLEDFAADLYVGTDNYNAGVEMGIHLVEVTGGKANVAIMSGAPGYPNLEERIRGIQDAVAGYPGIQLLRLEYNQYDALTVMEKYYLILRESPQIDTLVAVEGTSGQTLGQMPSSGFEHVLVFDDNEESLTGLRNQVFDGIMSQQNYQMGVICVEELYRWSTEGSFSAEKIYMPVEWLTADSLEEDSDGE
ncbi:MAG: sugar ABC transporter substrate-binding protein [Faecousia sp.]